MEPSGHTVWSWILASLIAACGGDDPAPLAAQGSSSPAVVENGATALRVLAGTVVGPGNAPVAGVTIRGRAPSVRGRLAARRTQGGALATLAVTDAQGRFVLVEPPLGAAPYEIDGTTATTAGAFPRLTFSLVAAPGASGTSIRLPDLSLPGTAQATLPLDAGSTTAETTVDAGAAALVVPAGVTVAGNGEAALTPLTPRDQPGALPEGFHAVALALLSHEGLAFAPPADLFLGTTLAPGAVVEIHKFAGGVWAPLGPATVEPDGRIAARGLADGAGWYAAVLPIDPFAAAAFEGSVAAMRGGNAPEPVEGVLVRTSTGQSAVTDAMGRFVLFGVPAYDVAALPTPVAVSIDLEIIASPALGAEPVTLTLDAAAVQPGGFAPLPPVLLDATPIAILAGVVTDSGGAALAGNASVSIAGPLDTSVAPDGAGRFARIDLPDGRYTISYPFSGGARSVSLDVAAGSVTTAALQRIAGAGSRTIEVHVRTMQFVELGGPSDPLSGATVTLVGSDAISAGGLVGISNADGIVRFEQVDGPFDATAQSDVRDLFGPGAARKAVSVLDVDPADDRLRLPLQGEPSFDPGATDAQIVGTFQNVRANFDPFTDQLLVFTEARLPDGGRASGFGFVQPDGSYFVDVPSGSEVDLIFLDNNGFTGTVGMVVRTGIAAPEPKQSLTLDFDLAGPDYIPFDRTIEVTIENLVPFSFPALSVGFDLDTGSPSVFNAPTLFAMSETETITLMVPDFAATPIVAARFNLFAGAGEQIGIFPLPLDEAAVTFTLPPVPALLAPASGVVPLAEAELLPVSFARDPGLAGPNRFLLDGGSFFEPGPFARATWTIYSAPTHSDYALPPVALPMFLPGYGYATVACALRPSGGSEFDFDRFFSGAGTTEFAEFSADQSCAVGMIEIQ